MLVEKYEIGSEEIRNFKKTKVEEYLNIDESLIELEKSSSVIRLEMNSIELPLFSKDPKRIKNQIKVYNFKADGSSYLEVEAPAGFGIPGEFEERVFIALTKIMKKNNYNKTFTVTINEIFENLNVSNWSYLSKVRNALTLLAKTNYTFNSVLYSNEQNGILEGKIISTIMSVKIITRKDKNTDELEQFNDNRIKEVYVISFNDNFYNNIITKGYLAFDSEKLLAIENSVARSIFTIIEKWRKYNLYLKRPAFFIARRVPLKWEKKNVRRTISVIERALEDLKKLNLLKDFNIIKESKWELCEVEIFFDESHNKIKEQTFYNEKQESNVDMYVTSTLEKLKDISEEIKDSSGIINMFPDKVKLMKTFEPFIKESIKKYGFEYVKYTSEYVILKKPTKSIKSYLSQALDNNWADEYIANKKIKEIKNNSKPIEKTIQIEEAQIIEENPIKVTWEEFENLESDIQEKIKVAAFEEFLIQTESIDNKTIRGIFEKSKKSHILKVFNEYEIPKEKIVLVEELKVKEISNIKIENREINSESKKVLTDTFSTVSKFMLKALTYIKNENLDIDSSAFMTLFNHFKEYEDEFVTMTYDEESKIGKIIKK